MKKMEYVNTGSDPNLNDGDSMRVAIDKINRNFQSIHSDLNNKNNPDIIFTNSLKKGIMKKTIGYLILVMLFISLNTFLLINHGWYFILLYWSFASCFVLFTLLMVWLFKD